MVAFGATSLLAGISQTPGQLVVCRLLQGAAAAVLMPQVLATFRTVLSGTDRASAFGIYGAVAGLAAAVGVILGGVLTQADLFGLSWRAVFLVNVPVALIVTVLALVWVPETRDPAQRRIDGLGALILAGAMVAIVYPLLEGRQQGWPLWCFALIAAGILAVGALILLERRPHAPGVVPLIQVEQFSVPAFSAGVLVQLFLASGCRASR